jgi:hypothetical protein
MSKREDEPQPKQAQAAKKFCPFLPARDYHGMNLCMGPSCGVWIRGSIQPGVFYDGSCAFKRIALILTANE